MQSEIREEKASDLNVEILGADLADGEPTNPEIPNLGDLPWLKSQGGTNPGSAWDVPWAVTYRDVWIVGPDGDKRAVFNLTEKPLGTPENYAALKQLILDAAVALDTDSDGLRDDWERHYFGDLVTTNSRDGDSDGDGFSDWDEFAFASAPDDARSLPGQPVYFGSVDADGVATPSVSFRCCAGNQVTFRAELSQDLLSWTGSAGAVQEFGQRKNYYDGHGAVRIVFVLGQDARSLPQWFVRTIATAN